MAGLLSLGAFNGNNIPPWTPTKGLLGLGGFGGGQPPAGLLGKYYSPEEERRKKIAGAMTQAGIQLLTNGRGSFGEVLGQGLAGAVQGAQQAGHDYRQEAMGYNQYEQQQADRQRQIENDQFNRNRLNRQDAWTNTQNQRTLEEQQQADEERQAQRSAIMDWANQKETAQPGFLDWAKNFPQEAAKMYSAEMMPPAGEGFTLGEGQVRYGPNGQTIATGPASGSKPTDDMREYDMAKQQGYNGTFQQYMLEMKKAGASSVSINGGDGNFDKELSKGVAGVYTSAMEAGQNAVATKSAAQQLRVLMKNRGGALDGLAAAAAPYLPPGLVPEGANDVVAAQAIVAGLIPKQRVPGSGTTSDFDARKFAESLVSIWNKPGANEIITNTMESYADYQIEVSNVIADVASNPQITNKAAAIRQQIAQIPDPFIGWKQYMAASGSGSSGGGKVIDGYTIRRVQ